MLVDGSNNVCIIPDERGDVVLSEIADRVPPVISEVVEDQIEPVGEQRLEGIVRIRGETVGMTQDQPRTFRVAVSPEDDGSMVRTVRLVHGKGFGNFPARGLAVALDTVLG